MAISSIEVQSQKFNTADSELISSLHDLVPKSKGKLVKCSVYLAPADPDIEVTSWKMNEFKYYDIPSPFPTLARGLFTTKVKDGPDGKSGHRIVVRGYDKFFNIGEVPWTAWEALKDHTAAPYILTLKSNGCIIFIGALTPSKIVITSKHSLGSVQNAPTSHAEAGEAWVRKYLDQKGKTEADLAKRLWDDNLTAVAELCDDSFEEHVLQYSLENTGLHLHGLNVCKKSFTTLTQSTVDAFAVEWGFIKTKSTVLDSIDAVQAFTASVSEKQEWEGEAVEGFVVRTRVVSPPTPEAKGVSPYKPGTDFFFKVKFDEPYMMYRDWREITRTLLNNGLNVDKLSKAKMKRPETKVYVRWVVQEIKRDMNAFEGYSKGKGIISTREKFLAWLASEEGKKKVTGAERKKEVAGVEGEEEQKTESGKFKGKTIIVPVAIPGCGKTTIAIALVDLFGFGHTQSDDVKAKKPAPVFIKNVLNELKKHQVVIADKNNHQIQHRQQLRDAINDHGHHLGPVHLLALNWSISSVPPSTIRRICGDRIFHRGENHQSLVPDAHTKAHEDVIWQFIRSTEELGGNEVDEIIEMDIVEDEERGGFEGSVRKAVEGVVRVLGLEMPSEERIKKAVEKANAYVAPGKNKNKNKKDNQKTTGSEEETKKKEKKAKLPRYYALLPEIDVQHMLKHKFSGSSHATEDQKKLWNHFLAHDRITDRPHITLVHERSLDSNSETVRDDKALWDRCAELDQLGISPTFEMRLNHVVWNDQVMVITVDDVLLNASSSSPSIEDQRTDPGLTPEQLGTTFIGAEFVSTLPQHVRARLHITVGTAGKDVPPVEGKTLVEGWRKRSKDGKKSVEGIHEMELGGNGDGVIVLGRVKGMIH